MLNHNNSSKPESDFDQILKVTENYKYSFEASNNEAWNKFSAARAAEKNSKVRLVYIKTLHVFCVLQLQSQSLQ